MVSFLVKFVALYASLAVFLLLFTSWSGTGEEIGGWNDFKNTLNAGPGQWMLTAPSMPFTGYGDFSDAYSTTYVSPFSTDYCEHLPAPDPNDGDVMNQPNLLWNGIPPQEWAFSIIPWQGNFSRIYVSEKNWAFWTKDEPYGWWDTQSVMFEKGEWMFTSHWRGSVKTPIHYIVSLSIFGVEERPGCDVNMPVKNAMNYMSESLLWSTINVTSEKLVRLDFKVKHDKPIMMSSNGGIWIHIKVEYAFIGEKLSNEGEPWLSDNLVDYPVYIVTNKDRMTRLNTPPAVGSLTECSNIFCAIGQFFGSLISWIGFLVAGTFWLISAIIVIIAWLCWTTGQFFNAIYDLSFGEAFGPLSPIISIITTVFLVYIIITIILIIRGTSGSLGV